MGTSRVQWSVLLKNIVCNRIDESDRMGSSKMGYFGITVSDKQRFSWDAEGANVKGIKM